jgi:hypothetical protein
VNFLSAAGSFVYNLPAKVISNKRSIDADDAASLKVGYSPAPRVTFIAFRF